MKKLASALLRDGVKFSSSGSDTGEIICQSIQSIGKHSCIAMALDTKSRFLLLVSDNGVNFPVEFFRVMHLLREDYAQAVKAHSVKHLTLPGVSVKYFCHN